MTPNSPSAQSSTSAGLSGQVNPNGLATTAYFEYGIDLSDRGPGSSTVLYDQSTPAQQVGSDSTDHPISIPVAGLVPNALYHVRIVATNSAGTTVGPDQTFTTPASAPPPPPVLGQAVNATPVSGVVFIKPPPGKTLAGDTAALSKGTGFVPLTEARQIPTGSEVDALNGSLKLISNTGQIGKTQTATLTGGVFKVTQARKGITKGIADFNLVESAFQGAPSYGTCKTKHKAGDATIASLSSKTLQLLQGQRPRQVPHHRPLRLRHRPRHHLHRRRPLRRHPHPRHPRHRPRGRLRPPQDHPPPRGPELPRQEAVGCAEQTGRSSARTRPADATTG